MIEEGNGFISLNWTDKTGWRASFLLGVYGRIPCTKCNQNFGVKASENGSSRACASLSFSVILRLAHQMMTSRLIHNSLKCIHDKFCHNKKFPIALRQYLLNMEDRKRSPHRPRRFAPLHPHEAVAAKELGLPKLKGIIFDVDGTLCLSPNPVAHPYDVSEFYQT